MTDYGYDEQYDDDYVPTQAEIQAAVAQAIEAGLNELGEGRNLSDVDRDLICEFTVRAIQADPSLGLDEAMVQGFVGYRQAVEGSTARSVEDRASRQPGERVTPKGEHSWHEDLTARELVRTTDPEQRAYGESTALREASRLAEWRLQAARRLDEDQAPLVDADTARSVALDAFQREGE
jgi:hypothetical protein